MNKPNNIKGIGTTNGTKATNTPTTNSSARMLPNKRKDNDNGFVKENRLNFNH